MEIKNIYGSVIYSDDSETIKETLLKAVKQGEDLRGADLQDAKLQGADLQDAKLQCAYLRGANLQDADLRGADLRGANLQDADLRGAKKIPMFCKWSHGITDNLIHIGCEKRSVKDWKKFLESEEEIETKRNTNEFKQIEAVIRGYIAYLET